MFAGAPGVGGTPDGAAHIARLDHADAEHGFACSFQILRYVVGLLGADDCDHADPAIEGTRQFARLDCATGLKEGEQAGQGPGVGIYDRVAAIGQNPRNILE